MRIEHLALNMDAARSMVAWYTTHLGMPIHKTVETPVYAAFLGEPPSLLEIYRNPEHPFLEPAGWDPLTCHLALTSDQLGADIARLVAACATLLDGGPDADDHGLAMLRCPWGLPLQLCRRHEELVRSSRS